MTQYIDKSAIVAEIERRIKEVSQIEKASYEIGLCDAYKIVFRFLDTLEVKEVDSTDAFIGKACEWLNNFYSEDRHCYLVAEDINDFKKYMEE